MKLTEAFTLARSLMEQLGVPGSWVVVFDKSNRRFGCCKFRSKTISLSRHLVELNSREDVEDVIRHEIAHALLGPGYGHGPKWKEMAVSCGAKPERCYDETLVVTPIRKWIGTCPRCRGRIKRHTRRKGLYCKECFTREDYIEPFNQIYWTPNKEIA